jgi:hypothetical protein
VQGQKIPAVRGGLKAATTDPETIRSWWRENPEYNVAIATEGMLVLDIDPGGESWLADMPVGELVAAPMSRTPRGGAHYWFRQLSHLKLRNTAGLLAANVDTRANGGYVLVAPSRTQAGAYQWVRELTGPEAQPLVPDWLVKPADETQITVTPADETQIAIVDGKRNDWLYRRACALRGAGLNADEILEALESLNLRCCDPPLSMHELAELRTIAQSAQRHAPNPDTDRTIPETPRFVLLRSSEEVLDKMERPRYIVDGVLVEGQPAVIGGRTKTLKTSIAVDLVLSLGSGKDFLGQWPSRKRKVAFWSGESGAATIMETAQRVAKAKQIDLADCSVLWGFDLPKLALDDHLAHMEEVITSREINVAVIDPLYLSLLSMETAGKASNVFAMGSLLQPLGELGQRTKCTFIVLHHFRKSGVPNPEDPATLEELSQSGISEWARQWILLQRRSAYQVNGRHELWLRCGGSAGHAGLYAVDVEEGLYDAYQPEGGRHWDVLVRSAQTARTDAKDEKAERQARIQAEKDKRDQVSVLEALAAYPEGETLRVIRESLPTSGAKTQQAVNQLLRDGRIETVTIQKGGREYAGFRLSN